MPSTASMYSPDTPGTRDTNPLPPYGDSGFRYNVSANCYKRRSRMRRAAARPSLSQRGLDDHGGRRALFKKERLEGGHTERPTEEVPLSEVAPVAAQEVR